MSMMKATASGQSIRDVLLNIKAQGDPGNAQRIRQEAQRIKKAEDDLNRERTGRSKQSTKYLSDEEQATARYWLARMQRERQYAAEKKRNDNEEASRRKKMADEELRRQRDSAREYEKSMRDQQRMQEKAAKEAARAAIAAEREQMRWGSQLARQMDRDIAARDRTRREFAEAADIRHGRTNRLGISGIGQDAVGVLRGIGHIGISAGLFGDNAESVLDALLAVEGGFNVTRYGAPLLTNLARRRGVRGAVLGGSRRLSQLLGVGVGVGGSAAGTALGGTVGLIGAGAGALVGGGLGVVSAIDGLIQAYMHGAGRGASPGSYTATVGNWESELLRGRPLLRTFLGGGAPGIMTPWDQLDASDKALARMQGLAANRRESNYWREQRAAVDRSFAIEEAGTAGIFLANRTAGAVARNTSTIGTLGELANARVSGSSQFQLAASDRAALLAQQRQAALDNANLLLQSARDANERRRAQSLSLALQDRGSLGQIERDLADAADGKLSTRGAATRLAASPFATNESVKPALQEFASRQLKQFPNIEKALDESMSQPLQELIKQTQQSGEKVKGLLEQLKEVDGKFSKDLIEAIQGMLKVAEKAGADAKRASEDAVDQLRAEQAGVSTQGTRVPGVGG